MAYIGNGPGVASQRVLTTLTATDGQTTFVPTSGYTLGYVDVYFNGVKLIDGSDYTAANGVNIVLTEAATAGDIVEVVTYLPRGLSDGYTKAEADARYMDINAVTLPDQTSNSGKFLTTDGTNASWAEVPDEVIISATEPTGVSIGQLWYDTTTKALKAYDGSLFLKVAAEPITLTNITGLIYNTVASSLTLTGTGFLSGELNITFTPSGGSGTSVTVTAASDTSATVVVPSAIFNLASGTVVAIQAQNADSSTSNSLTATVSAAPSGGTITTFGDYKVHTFTSSGTFSVPAGFPTTSVSFLAVAGGGGGGCGNTGSALGGAGGGGGGMISSTTTINPSTNYTITVGGGGAGDTSDSTVNADAGSNTAAFGTTALGGGGGGSRNGVEAGDSGGSGGGSCGTAILAGGTGTSGQGNRGGNKTAAAWGATGGGGKSTAGGDTAGDQNTAGGAGLASSISGSSITYAGGGGGGANFNNQSAGSGGTGGGGAGASYASSIGGNGTANRGGGGGGASEMLNSGKTSSDGGNGGSGVVVLRYKLI